jgi:ribonuclease J
LEQKTLKHFGTSRLKAGADEVLFVPLGGVGEIGMNLYCYGHNGRWLVVDFGVTFADHNAPGIDVITADIRFLEANAELIDGIVLTHSHEDHLGALPYLWDILKVPVYASPFAHAMARTKMEENQGEEAIPSLVKVKIGEDFKAGSFDLRLVPMTHSIAEACALLIKTSAGNIFHTGDWKNDPDPLIGDPINAETLRQIGQDDLLALVGDSTNAMEPGHSGSEANAAKGLLEAVAGCKNRVAVTMFATNVARMQSAFRAAAAAGRHVGVAGRSIKRVLACAQEAGYLTDRPIFVDEDRINELPRDKVLLLCTGSQGEGRAAMARIAQGKHPSIALSPGDSVIFSSKTIPGNEKEVARIENMLAERDIEIIEDIQTKVHVTGHPRQDELKWLYGLMKPKTLVPMHGELRHLKAHARLAKAEGVAHTPIAVNGQVLRLARDSEPQIIGEVTHGRWGVDGDRLLDVDGQVFRERKRMMHKGLCHISLVMSDAGALKSDPRVLTLGLLDGEVDDPEILTDAEDFAWDTLERLPKTARQDDQQVKGVMIKTMKRFFNDVLGRKPLIEVTIHRVGK